jgi:hypothetical protein
MKLSTETVKVLENFALINPAIVLNPGKQIVSISDQGSVLAAANIEEYLEYEMPIGDLKAFLQSLSLFKDPELNVDSDKFLTINEDDDGSPNSSCNFHFGAKELIRQSPVTEVNLQDRSIEFTLSQSVRESVIKSANVFRLKKISFFSRDGHIMVGSSDPEQPDQNTYEVEVGDWAGDPFKLFLQIERMRLLPGDYAVGIETGAQNMAEFKNTAGNVAYWISLEPDSEYSQ